MIVIHIIQLYRCRLNCVQQWTSSNSTTTLVTNISYQWMWLDVDKVCWYSLHISIHDVNVQRLAQLKMYISSYWNFFCFSPNGKERNRVTEIDKFLQICLMNVGTKFRVKFSLSLLQLREMILEKCVMGAHHYCLLTFIANQISPKTNQRSTAKYTALLGHWTTTDINIV